MICKKRHMIKEVVLPPPIPAALRVTQQSGLDCLWEQDDDVIQFGYFQIASIDDTDIFPISCL